MQDPLPSFRRSLAALGATALCAATLASAQESEPDTGDREVEQIVVTGSRIARRDYASESPIVTISDEMLNNSSAQTLEQSLNQLPQFVPGDTSFVAGAADAGLATLNLRGLGDFRNLVLLDGRRVQPSTSSTVVDINNIPSIIIGNVEVITGGASAVYGSDAVAGVVNFKLRDDFEGLELRGQLTQPEAGDGQQTQIGLLIGGGFADGRGHGMLALEYTDRQVIMQRDRDFYQSSYRLGTGTLASTYLPQGYYSPSNNPPSQAAVDSLFASYGYGAGAAASTSNFAFNMDESLFSVVGGAPNYRGELYPEYAIADNGTFYYNSGYTQILSLPLERYSLMSEMEYDVGGGATAYAQILSTTYSTLTNSAFAPADGLWVLNVPRDAEHPVPSDLEMLLSSRAAPDADFQMGKAFRAAGPRTVEHDNHLFQATVGLRGDLFTDWTWDVYGSHGRTQLNNRTVQGGVNYATLQNLINMPYYGEGAADPPNGYSCTTGIQLFGDQPISQDCIDWISEPLKATYALEQDTAEATVQGGLFELPAGQVRFAAGLNYRENSYEFSPPPLLDAPQASAIVGTFGAAPTVGSTRVAEIYAEFLIPVLHDLPLIQSLNLMPAFRHSDYELSGGVNTYKMDLDWSVNSSVRIRGGYQRAIRAPNVAELFSGGSLAIYLWPGSDPCSITTTQSYGNNSGNPAQAQVRQLCEDMGVPDASTFVYGTPIILGVPLGNPEVQPEVADTFTIGTVWQSSSSNRWLSGLSASLDFYSIDIDDAIGLLPPSDVYAKCFNADGSNPTYSAANPYCQVIHRDDGATTTTGIATGIPTWTDQLYENLGGFRTSGIDLQVDWNFDIGEAGVIDINSIASYLNSFEIKVSPDAAWQDFAGTIGNTTTSSGAGNPEWRLTSTFSHSIGQLTTGLRWRYYDAMAYYTDVSIPGSSTAGTGAYSLYDLFGTMILSDALSVRYGIDNLLDEDPKVVGGIPGSTQPSTYDPIGRRFYLGFTANF